MHLKPREFEAADTKTGMTLDEVTETTTGFLHPRIKTARVVPAASK